jgi:hypothetical protein
MNLKLWRFEEVTCAYLFMCHLLQRKYEFLHKPNIMTNFNKEDLEFVFIWKAWLCLFTALCALSVSSLIRMISDVAETNESSSFLPLSDGIQSCEIWRDFWYFLFVHAPVSQQYTTHVPSTHTHTHTHTHTNYFQPSLFNTVFSSIQTKLWWLRRSFSPADGVRGALMTSTWMPKRLIILMKKV